MIAPLWLALACANAEGAFTNGLSADSIQHDVARTLVYGVAWRHETQLTAVLMRRALSPRGPVVIDSKPPSTLPANAQWLASTTLSPSVT